MPVLLYISPLEYSKVIFDRLWLGKVDWASWTNTVEKLSEDKIKIDECNEIWSKIEQSISEASDNLILI